jgi:hypothetical protein
VDLSAFSLVENILNIHRNNVLKGIAAAAANKVTGQHRICPCKSARLGINGLKENNGKNKYIGKHYIHLVLE